MVSAGLSNTSTQTCPEFKHKTKFPYKKVQVLQKMAQFCQLHFPHQWSAHQILCSVSQIINSSAWQIWPSPRLSLVGIGASCYSFKAGNLDLAVGCMWKDNNWSWCTSEWTGSRAKTRVHDSWLWWDCRAGPAQGLCHHLHKVPQWIRQMIMAKSQILKEMGNKLWKMEHWNSLGEVVLCPVPNCKQHKSTEIKENISSP